MTILGKSLIAAALIGSIATPLVIQYQTQLRLAEENGFLREQLEQQTAAVEENRQRADELARAVHAALKSSSEPPSRELLRLRGEIGRLRVEASELRAQLAESRGAQTVHIVTPLQGGAGDIELPVADQPVAESSFDMAMKTYLSTQADQPSTLLTSVESAEKMLLLNIGYTPSAAVADAEALLFQTQTSANLGQSAALESYLNWIGH